MKPLLKKDKASSSVSEESSSQRPKRSTYLKNLDGSNGLLWREETDLKRALYASLQETRKRNLEDEEEVEDEEEEAEDVKDAAPEEKKKEEAATTVSENGEDEILKKAKVHAQRKFAQGTNPNSPVPTPQKVPQVNNSTKELLPYKRPKTEDFLTFLCLRGTSILPPSLDFLNCCSKSDASSDCRSLSPDPENKDFLNHKESASKGSDPRERNGARHENLLNGVARKLALEKRPLKKHAISSQTAKKTVSKLHKETNIVRKRKSRDDNEDQEFKPTNSSSRSKPPTNTRTRSSTFHALREKYKKQRLATSKKKVPASPGNADVKGLTTRSQSIPKKSGKAVSRGVVSSKRRSSSVSPVLNKKSAGSEQKLAVEKRKSLRSAQSSRGHTLRKGSNKKTLWLRRAKLVPTIVDVESDSSEPEVVVPSPGKKMSPKQEKVPRVSGRLRDKQETSKAKEGLTPRQILLRKHMQSRLAAKKSALQTKDVKSKTIVKKAARQILSKKVFKKGFASKTMSLRKDNQNKRVTRSAKHQIEDMLWSHPERKSKVGGTKPASRIDRKRLSSDEQLLPKKPKLTSTKPVESKLGKITNDKDFKTKSILNIDSNKITKPSVATKVPKNTETSVASTRASRAGSQNEPKPGCSFGTDEVLHTKINNANISDNKTNKNSEIKLSKSGADNGKKETENIKNKNRSVNLKDEKATRVQEDKKHKSNSKIDSNSNLKLFNDKENNLLQKDKVFENDLGTNCSSPAGTIVQNNLNLLKNDKNINKDISKLINLNVDFEESSSVDCQPSCSGINQKNLSKEDIGQGYNSDFTLSPSIIKKHYDARYIKNLSFKDEKLQKTIDKNRKIENKINDKSSKTSKKGSDNRNVDKSKFKKESQKNRKEPILLSDSDSNTDILESDIPIEKTDVKNKKIIYSKEKNEIKKSNQEKTENGKRQIKSEQKKESKKSKSEFSKDVHSKTMINLVSEQDTDDDSDNDITLDQYLKKNPKIFIEDNNKTTSVSVTTVGINTTSNINSVSSPTKDLKVQKKESDKESQKHKKEGESSKHKEKHISKDKNSEKSLKKDEKTGKNSEKSLAKLLKKERSKSIRKEEKLKHKRDGSSSSKSSKDKDGSKLNKKYGDKEGFLEKRGDSKSEFSDKKDKSSKKESKLSRSNSYDDTKSPKKKKKLTDDYKQIEEIKNLINNSTILNEISGFKEFKRRLSGDKSELKRRLSKSKKRKKLALLKEKKLSKRLSSKLLRKYSKKKGLKKKNKLKKKDLKKESKLGVKSKNKKHKAKSDHKKDNQDKNKNSDKTLSSSVNTETAGSSSNLPKSTPKPTQAQNKLNFIPLPISSSVQTCTSAVAVSSTEVIHESGNSAASISSRGVSVDKDSYHKTSMSSTNISDSLYPNDAFVQSARNSISKLPLHFAHKTPSYPKIMADAATNTCDDDLDETLSPIPELLRNVEMSVGTQTITPVGSPSPTAEMKSIVSAVTTQSSNYVISKTNISTNSVHASTSITPDKFKPKLYNTHATQVISKTVNCVNKSLIPVTQIITAPSIMPKTTNSLNSINSISMTKGFTVSPGKYNCVNILPMSSDKPNLSPFKNTPSLLIPVVSSNMTNPLVVKNDILPKGIICNPIHNIGPGKSSPLTNCVNNLVIPISPDKQTIFTSSLQVSSVNYKVLTSNPTPALIVGKTITTTSSTVFPISPSKPTFPINLTNLNSSILPGTSITDSVSTSTTTVTPEKPVTACKVNSPATAVTTVATNISSTIPAKPESCSDSNSSTVITPEKSKVPSSNSNTSQLTATPGKTKSAVSSTTLGQSPSPKTKKRNVKKGKSSNVTPSKLIPFPLDDAKVVSAPVYYPEADEFNDPLEYINKIRPEAEQYGICKIVPPPSFKPECKVNDDMRFTAHNQYLHKMLHRWGPNVQHTACIRKHLKTQKVKLEQAPLIGGIELDVSKFYHTVQQFGGLQQVIEKKKWQKVADAMRVPKTAQDRVTKLYDAYCKYLVSYDTLPPEEKQKIEEEVLADHEKCVKSRHSQSESEKEDEDTEDENNDCVSKGRSMSLSNFFRIARNTMSMWYKNDPLPEEVEHEFWKLVTERQQHVVVHAGNIDSSVTQSGFPSNKSSFAKHPWNLKILTNNSRSILKSMGPISGITIPTLHVGMLFTTGCWYRDPHSFPWIEYLHTGASKIWYGIPANGCEKFRNAMKKIMPDYCAKKPLWLSSDTAMVPPDLLVKHGASLSRTIQKSGQFVVIFPESFTSTICSGYCVSESVYFAPTSWLDLAVKAFQDIQNSCESPAFSLEKLLFSIGNDPKPQLKVHLKTLQKILPMIENIRHKELHLRAQLNELGLKQFERLPLMETKEKKKKARNLEEENDHECEVCRTPCYVSMVIYPQEDAVYCLPHALEQIQKKNLKSCKLKFTYSENDLNELVKKITDLVSQLPDSSDKKKPSKKKASTDET